MSSSNSLEQLATLVAQVADYRRRAVALGAAGKALLEVDLAPVRGDGQLAGQVQAIHAERRHDVELDVVPADGKLADLRRRRDWHDPADLAGPLQRDLQRDHTAERPTHRESDLADPQSIEKAPLGSGLVTHGHRRKSPAVRLAGGRVS